MSLDSDDDTSYKKNQHIEALSLNLPYRKTKDLNKDSLSSLKLKAQKSPGARPKIKKLYPALKEFLLEQDNLSEEDCNNF